MRDNLKEYWEKTVELMPKDCPGSYLKFIERSEFLNDIFKRYVSLTDSILELGCNSGRNLIYLHKIGYENLSGVDINKLAVDMCPKYLKIACEPIETFVDKMPNYDTILTMAVLQHLPKESEFIFPLIAEKAKTLITIEDEVASCVTHFPRDYQKVFEPLGFKQVEYYSEIKSQTKDFRGRVFKK
jgi:2-polyprenyl-3-methyl-5-hydroxy-6-metoxy-1,4-benzoquinol methylase